MSNVKRKSLNQRDNLERRVVEAFGGLAVRDIADRLEQNYTSFWNWTQRRTKMPLTVLVRIGEETGYSINWLLTGEGDKLTVDEKRYSDEELAIMVNNLRYGGLFTIEGFVYELARINERFRKMLTREARRDVAKIHDAFIETVEALGDYADSVVEHGREQRSAINAEPVGGEVNEIVPADMMLAPVVAHIGGGKKEAEKEPSREDVRRMIEKEDISEIEKRLKPRRRKTG